MGNSSQGTTRLRRGPSCKGLTRQADHLQDPPQGATWTGAKAGTQECCEDQPGSKSSSNQRVSSPTRTRPLTGTQTTNNALLSV